MVGLGYEYGFAVVWCGYVYRLASGVNINT